MQFFEICIETRYGNYINGWHLADTSSQNPWEESTFQCESIKNQTDSGRGPENETQDIFLILIHFLLLSSTCLTSFEQLNPIHVVHLSISSLISYCKAAKQ